MKAKHRPSKKIRDIRVRDWAELQEQLFADTWNPTLQRFRSDYAYRGVANAGWDLHTSLSRLGGNFRELEVHLLRNFKKYASNTPHAPESEWTWLALAQHHGLPTRLLDWTYSPYTALHFATVDFASYDSDAAIWCVDFVAIHSLLPDRLRRALRRERSNVFTSELLQSCAESLGALEKLARQHFALFVEPPSLDARIVNQYALFSFMSDPETQFDEWIAERGASFARRILIPKELKWEVRDKLDQANITERVLFPGLDGLCEWLRHHYMPRPDAASERDAREQELLDPSRRKMRARDER